METREVIIIGSGPSGLTAAVYNARANLKPLVIAGLEPGGQLMGTTTVENFPGFPEGIMGPQLMQNMIKQAENFGAEFLYDVVTKVDFTEDTKKVYVGDQMYEATTVILAMGSSPRKLGLNSENIFWGKGVSTCATCDGAFYRDKVVAVVGGGDSAMEESNFLTKFAKKVYIIHRKDSFRASKIMQQKVFDNEKIEILWNTEVKDILGEQLVNALVIENLGDSTRKNLEVDGMFLAIGHLPNTKFLENQVKLDDHGYVLVSEGTHTKTSVEGVFVAGDVHDHHYQQAITAAGMGCMAAMDVEKYINSK